MELRNKICRAIDLIASNVAQKFNDSDKDNKIEAWHLGLKQVSDDQIDIGLEKTLETNEKFFPTCGQFRELCLSQGNIEQEALSAFNLVWNMNRSTISPYFKDVCIAETIRNLGGLTAVSMWETKDRNWKEKEFIETYKINRKREYKNLNPLIENGNMPLQLIGDFVPGSKERIELELKEKDEKLLLDYARSELEKKSITGQKVFTTEELNEEARLSKSNIRLQIAQRETSNGLQRLLDIAKGETDKPKEPYKFNSGKYKNEGE